VCVCVPTEGKSSEAQTSAKLPPTPYLFTASLALMYKQLCELPRGSCPGIDEHTHEATERTSTAQPSQTGWRVDSRFALPENFHLRGKTLRL